MFYTVMHIIGLIYNLSQQYSEVSGLLQFCGLSWDTGLLFIKRMDVLP